MIHQDKDLIEDKVTRDNRVNKYMVWYDGTNNVVKLQNFSPSTIKKLGVDCGICFN